MAIIYLQKLSNFVFSNLVNNKDFIFDYLNSSQLYLFNGNTIKQKLFAKLSNFDLLNFIEKKTFMIFLNISSDITNV